MDDAGSSLQATMARIGREARDGARALRLSTSEVRTAAIAGMAAAIRRQADAILAANLADQADARANGLSDALIDRMALDAGRIAALAEAVDAIAAIPDPVGAEIARWGRPNGLDIARVRTPIGVIAMIYESRPNVTADAAALCVRSGNASILRGGSECLRSNLAVHAAVVEGLVEAGLPASCVQAVPTADRAAVGLILGGLDGAVDLIIPRGGKSLVARVQAEARAPVLGHLEGLNHVFVHADADLEKAKAVVVNAKMRRVSVCGSAETLLIDRADADRLLPPIAAALVEAGCELRGDGAARAIAPMAAASAEDWSTEYLAPILSIRIVDGLDQAIEHINHYGSHHTDAIVTESLGRSRRFLAEVDSSSVMVNAPTCFADGFEYGLGAEIGISTDKLHARGPVGLEGLTSEEYVVFGDGHVRS